MEADTEDSTVQGLRDRRTKLISKKCWRKIKKKVFKRRNWLIHNVGSNINTVAKELVSSWKYGYNNSQNIWD